jgi:hypothetical protein
MDAKAINSETNEKLTLDQAVFLESINKKLEKTIRLDTSLGDLVDFFFKVILASMIASIPFLLVYYFIVFLFL